MKNKQFSNMVLVMAGVILVGLVIWGWRSGQFGSGTKGTEREDLATLQNEKAPPDQIYRSILRLGKARNPEAQAFALQSLQSKNAVIRAAAYEALGFYEDSIALKELAAGMQDSERVVRLATIRGLSRNPSLERIRLAKEQLEQPNISLNEQIELNATLARIGAAADVEAAVTNLLKIAQQNTGSEGTDAAFRIASVAPRDPRVTQLFKIKLKGNDLRMMAFAIRHLASVKDPDVVKNLANYARHEKPEVRMASTQAAALACAADRMTIVQELLRDEKSEAVLQTVLQSLLIMPDARAQNILEEQIASGKLSPKLLDVAKKTLLALQKNPNRKGCP